MILKQTHTYAELELSRAAYDESADRLRKAGYDHAFDGETIDMHGIGITPEAGSELTRCSLSGFIVATYFKAEFS